MKLPRKSRPSANLDLPSFSDMAFLLIIFFMLTSQFVDRIGTKTTIPSSTSNPEDKPEKELPSISLTADRVLWNEQEVTLDELRRRLNEMNLPQREEDKRIIVVESAPDVKYERYYRVVTAVSHAGGVLALVEESSQGGGT